MKVFYLDFRSFIVLRKFLNSKIHYRVVFVYLQQMQLLNQMQRQISHLTFKLSQFELYLSSQLFDFVRSYYYFTPLPHSKLASFASSHLLCFCFILTQYLLLHFYLVILQYFVLSFITSFAKCSLSYYLHLLLPYLFAFDLLQAVS